VESDSKTVTLPLATLKVMVGALPRPAVDEIALKLMADSLKPDPKVEVRGTCRTCEKWAPRGGFAHEAATITVGACRQPSSGSSVGSPEGIHSTGMHVMIDGTAHRASLQTSCDFGCAMWRGR
jgi:hypothetical protein